MLLFYIYLLKKIIKTTKDLLESFHLTLGHSGEAPDGVNTLFQIEGRL